MEDEEGQVHLRGLSQHPASSEEDALNMLFLGDTNRAIAETPLNLASSRSHCLFTVSLEAVEEGSSIIRRSKLHLVDLAGSERTGKTQSTGTLFREATHINKSLHYLELVIVALHEARKGGPGRSHIPYRNSLMTSVLRDSLGGNCKTTMIATINPEGEHTDESISTCRFAQRVARITNCAVVNEALDPVVLSKQLKVRVSSLEAELALARGLEVGEGGSVQPPMTEEERAAAVAAARAWVGASDAQGQGQQQLELGSPPTMERIRLALDTCKVCAQEYRSLAESAAAAQQAQAAAAPTQQQQQPPHTPSRSASSSGGGDSELLSALREEVARLSSRLAQRDREVGALVARLEGGSSSSGSGGGGGRVAKSGSVGGGAVPTPPPPQPPPTLQIHLPPLPDGTPTPPQLLDDQDLALEAFRSRHASRDSMEDNKALLRAKYDSARNEAERVNACRARMGSLKEEIDRLRMARAVGALEGGSASSSSSSSEGGGAGSGEGERELLAALEGEKGAYKAAFNALRTQKGEIEQIQRLLEGARVRLEAEFQAWLSDCKAARVAAAAAVTLPASLASTPASSVPSSPARGAVSAGSRLPVAAAGGAGAGAGGASAGPGSNNTSMLGGLLASTIGGGLPGGSAAIPPRTSVSAPGKVVGGGSSGDVEDDIAAFYKLKAAAGSKK
jgi:kinesin family protein 6/9